LDRYHGHHHYHPYRRSDRGYFLDELKKEKAPIFDGEMNKFFRLHDYLTNMKVIIATIAIEAKANIFGKM